MGSKISKTAHTLAFITVGESHQSMWSESYRPNSLEEIVGQGHITKRLKFMVENIHQTEDDASFPHLLFAGPAGTGKTSIAIALMKDLFGQDWESNFIELNASDSRSISDIRTTVKDFARRGVLGSYEVEGRQIQIPFNVVFLDECDNLTPEAQAALRRIMERYAKQTRFILSCNYPHRIIDPIKDRCAFADARFKPIPSKAIYNALEAIKASEGLRITEGGLEAVSKASKGSMRKALNLLFSATRIPLEVEAEDVLEIVNEMSPKRVRQLLSLAIDANRLDSDHEGWLRAHRRIDTLIEKMGERGLSGVDILEAFHRTVQEDDKVPLALRRAIYRHIGEAIFWCSISQDPLLSAKTFLRRVTL